MSISQGRAHLKDAPLRERLADAIRVERFDQMRPLWPDLDEAVKERWRERADRLLVLIRNRGMKIEVADD